MDRYDIYEDADSTMMLASSNGEWVKYSDVEATERRLIEVEDMAAWYQTQHQQLVAERQALQARVRELEVGLDVLHRIAIGALGNPINDCTKFLNEIASRAQSLKGTP